MHNYNDDQAALQIAKKLARGEKIGRSNGKTGLSIFIAALIVALDLLLLWLGTEEYLGVALAVAAVGIFTFFGMLVLANYLSASDGMDKGEMRKAIAASFVVVYFSLAGLLAFTDLGESESGFAETILKDFKYLTIIIVGFYFTSRVIKEVRRLKKDSNEEG